MSPLPEAETNRSPALLKANPTGEDNPEAKRLFVPSGVNLLILPFASASNRSPALLNASPAGPSAEAMVVCTPFGVIRLMEPPGNTPYDQNRLPALSKASPLGTCN